MHHALVACHRRFRHRVRERSGPYKAPDVGPTAINLELGRRPVTLARQSYGRDERPYDCSRRRLANDNDGAKVVWHVVVLATDHVKPG